MVKLENSRNEAKYEQVLSNLKRLGVRVEQTKKPFSNESKNTSLMGNFEKCIVIKS
ncbi:hypothetical protein PGC35_20310 [Psychrobacillus sp. PGGUH221]|uniref:hypothetical protein n=1 Tax=Psychrobacillus sp. PGGUH221 TaxID=3020058 RepID=UPI0035C72CC8